MTDDTFNADELSLFLRNRAKAVGELNKYDRALLKDASRLIDDLTTQVSRERGLLKSPFINDPYALVWQAFKNLYPSKKCACYLEPAPDGWEKGDGYGHTTFQEDGSDPVVCVFSDFPIEQQVEIFAHELAHVAVGVEAGHGKRWEDAFDAIFQEYQRIGYEFFGKEDVSDV